MHYLLKTEPETYSFYDLEREGETVWDGVTNPVALKFLRSMQPGEKLVIYHTGDERTAVGTAIVVSVDADNPGPLSSASRPERKSKCPAPWPKSRPTGSLRIRRLSARADCQSFPL